MFYGLMQARRIRTLADLGRDYALRVWCLGCSRGVTIDAPPLVERFATRGWPIGLVAARARFRCRYCRSSAQILLLPASRPRPLPRTPPKVVPADATAEEKAAGRAAMEQLVGSMYRMFRGQAKRDRVVANGRAAIERTVRSLYEGVADRRWIAQLRATRRVRPELWLIVNPRLGRPLADRLTAALNALEDRPMCNRYQVRTAHAEAVQLKMGLTPDRGLNYAGEVFPGYAGLVIAADEVGAPYAKAMTWGFPLSLKGKQGQPLKPRPVNNAREDKLRTWMWRDSFERRRCLIPASAWAEAEGEKGKMTCTWHALPEDEPLALAGIWRPTDEWGDSYAMVMVDGCPQMAEVHDRMPVILRYENWQRWIAGSPAEAFALIETWLGELAIDRTTTLWAAKD